ncbi:MAG: carboxypeptidase-like regulatory domain-containing protein [Acidobacteriia bacterium]|nr:carboxypeptidase-like regulatory domain-containing protein [Terriglobia bacterium]
MRIRPLAALALLAAVPVAAQENPQEPPRTGSVAGIVSDGKSGDPVPKAVVILRREEAGGIAAVAGPDGKFALRDVEPGAYVLAVHRDGYVASGEGPQTVVVQAGQTTDGQLKLLRTGAISGRILDADGDPVSGVNIAVSPARARSGSQFPGGYATTNDRGEYRVFYLAPGEYRISATYAPRNGLDGVRVQRPPGAASGGEAYPAVYYPGVTNVRQAATVKLEPGAELQGFDLHLIPVRGAQVRGRVAGASGGASAPLLHVVILAPIGQPAQNRDFLVRSPTGDFVFEDVLPGSYRLELEAVNLNGENRTTARRMLEVGGADIDGIELTPAKPQLLKGRIVAPEGRKLPSGLLVALQSREVGERQAGGMAQVGADGAFTLTQITPGEYDVLVASTTGAEDDAYIEAIRIGAVDALAEGVRLADAAPPPLEIVLKPNGGAAECAVKDEKDSPVPGATVLLAPDAPKQRQAALFGECRTQADGTCNIVGITPGAYHVYAFPGGLEVDRRDPDALKPFEKNGQAVKFAEGERKRVNLKSAQPE